MSADAASPDIPKVMVSSTFTDLVDHRKAVIDAVLRLGFFPIGMEFDSARAGKDVISSSMEMVEQAEAYIGIISHRYGGVPQDPVHNPGEISITEREYRRARNRGIPVFMFLMSETHPVTLYGVEPHEPYQEKLRAFRKYVQEQSVTAPFSSVDELKVLVIQSLAELRRQLSSPRHAAARRTRAIRARAQGGAEPASTRPPALVAIPSFVAGHEFVGRTAELALLDAWAREPEPVLVLEAIGGMGKSTLTWEWVRERSRAAFPEAAGTLWFSFYEGGADMRAFAALALAYITGRPPREFRGKKTAELAQELVGALRERPFLLVLDGFERVLVAYHRLDAAQARDDEVDSDAPHRACTNPADADLLRQLVSVAPSKILITSRLMPAGLTNRTGLPVPGVRQRQLGGLHPDDALAMLRAVDVRGDPDGIRRYLTDYFENHPLLVGIVAGQARDYVSDPGNFDRWSEDPQGGAAIDLAKLDLSQRRTHILAAALNGLEAGARQLLSRIAALGGAVPFETVEALNPFLASPNEARSPRSHEVIGAVAEVRRLSNEAAAFQTDLRRERDATRRARLQESLWEAQKELAAAERELSRTTAAVDTHSRVNTRHALPRLVAGLQELQNRGLLNWDRAKNSYDLHPVVRGYAFDILERSERVEISRQIADHFQSRPPDKLLEAVSLEQVQQSINLFQSLVQAERYAEAVEFYRGDFAQTLAFSIEAPVEVLRMLRPFFPDGFAGEIAHVGNAEARAYLLNEVAIALKALDRSDEALPHQLASLRLYVADRDAENVSSSLANVARTYQLQGKLALCGRLLELKLGLGEAYREPALLAVAWLKWASHLLLLGVLDEAAEAYRAFAQYPLPKDRRSLYRAGDAEFFVAQLRWRQQKLTSKQMERAEEAAQRGNNRRVLRQLRLLRGELSLKQQRMDEAAGAFEAAVAMSRTAGVRADAAEAKLAMVKARSGGVDEARDMAVNLAARPNPSHTALAELFLALGMRGEALQHALAGYRQTWADGAPYVLWWDLQACGDVLENLGEPLPDLPPFDPAAMDAVPCEAEVLAMIDELRGGRTYGRDAGNGRARRPGWARR